MTLSGWLGNISDLFPMIPTTGCRPFLRRCISFWRSLTTSSKDSIFPTVINRMNMSHVPIPGHSRALCLQLLRCFSTPRVNMVSERLCAIYMYLFFTFIVYCFTINITFVMLMSHIKLLSHLIVKAGFVCSCCCGPVHQEQIRCHCPGIKRS